MRGVGLGASGATEGPVVPGCGDGKKLEKLGVPNPTMVLVLTAAGVFALVGWLGA